jgi:DNA repair exonuclease SbcCD ATPase subunit
MAFREMLIFLTHFFELFLNIIELFDVMSQFQSSIVQIVKRLENQFKTQQLELETLRNKQQEELKVTIPIQNRDNFFSTLSSLNIFFCPFREVFHLILIFKQSYLFFYFQNLTQKLENLTAQNEILSNKIKNLTQERKELAKRNAELIIENARLQEKNNELQQSLIESRNINTELQRTIEDLKTTKVSLPKNNKLESSNSFSSYCWILRYKTWIFFI